MDWHFFYHTPPHSSLLFLDLWPGICWLPPLSFTLVSIYSWILINVLTVHSESIQTPWLFTDFVKITALFFSSSIYTQYPIVMKRKNRFLEMFSNLLKINNYIIIQTLYSVLCCCTFGSDYSIESSWVWRYKFGLHVFGEFLPFFSADPLKFCQVGWGVLLHSYFQVSPEMFDWVQVQALAGPLKGIQRLISKPFLRCLGCVLRVVVLLEGEPLPHSEVLSTLEQVFIKDLCTLLRSSFPRSWLVSQSLLLKNSPTAWYCHHRAAP